MTTIVSIKPGPTQYSTREQLYALCVLLCWSQGLGLSDAGEHQASVTLYGIPGGNTGVSNFALKNNPNATDVVFTEGPNLAYSEVFFKVLGVQLVVEFDEDGVGVVSFPDQPVGERI